MSYPIWYQMCSLVKVIQFRTVPFQGGTTPVYTQHEFAISNHLAMALIKYTGSEKLYQGNL